jgi:hypothetical protein
MRGIGVVASTIVAVGLGTYPQIAGAQINMNYNAAPYCLQNPDGSGNCSYQTYYECKTAGMSPNMRCIKNPYSGANVGSNNGSTIPRTVRRR